MAIQAVGQSMESEGMHYSLYEINCLKFVNDAPN